jgi:hypothetical protein
MTPKETIPDEAGPQTKSTELAGIWTAALHVGQQNKQGVLTPAIRVGLSDFMTSTVQLALATVANPKEDIRPILERVRAGLCEATRLLPSIQQHLQHPAPDEVTGDGQRALARHAVATTRIYSTSPDERSSTRTVDASEHAPYLTTAATQLEEPDPSRLWLVEHLWQRAGTGLIGGSAKSMKTWLALDLALSIASDTRALDTFEVHRPGNVLYVCAEGGEGYVKQRLIALCLHRDLSLDSLRHRLEIIPRAIRIDTADGLGRLKATIRRLAPVVIILDPLVRLHRLDENSASSVSGMLSNLTELQQAHDLAIILVHHSTKQGAKSGEMGGQGFRGSSDFYAWGDSNILIKKTSNNQKRFVVATEHRAAPAADKFTLESTTDEHPRLQIVDPADSSEAVRQAGDASEKMDQDILVFLHRGAQPISEIRMAVKGSNARISEAVSRLAAAKRITQIGRSWSILNGDGTRPDGE